MLTGSQVRMARGALKWSIADLAKYSGVGERTIKRVESFDGYPQSNVGTLKKFMVAFEQHGIEFLGAADDGPGIRLWQA